MKIPVIVIFAPTATGKTELALKLFGKKSNSVFRNKAEIISADSMQAYRKLDIGTAKPSKNEIEELPHHLINIKNIDEQYNVSEFVGMADDISINLWKNKKIPVVAGGSGFYIRNFLLGLPKTPQSNEHIRNQLKSDCLKFGRDAMYEKLCLIDADSAKKINKNDEYRILRALEVFYITGKTRSSFELNICLREEFNFTTIVLCRERKDLYERINERVDKMFEMGLENEVHNLIASGATENMPGMKAIGYREWFLNDFKDVEKIKNEIKRQSRKYAKKQYTFMRDIPNAKTIFVKDDNSYIKNVEEMLVERLPL